MFFRRMRWQFWLIVAVMSFQFFTHLFWLPVSAHSGQTSIPWMMNRGMVLFDNLLEQHAPGSSVVAALAQRLIPLDPLTIDKLLNVALVLALTVLIFFAARRLSGSDTAGAAAVLVWAWWIPVYGNVLFYFNTILAFCVLAGMLVVTSPNPLPASPEFRGGEKPPLSDWRGGRGVRLRFQHYLFAGFLMGMATIFKQHAWAAAGLMGLWILVFDRSWRGLAFYIAGTLILPLIVVIVIAAQGNLENYIYWNWTFNLSGLMDGVPLDSNFFRKLLLTCIFIPPFALLMLRQTRWHEWLLVLMLWAATAFLLYPRFGESQAAGFLPFAAVMSGVVIGSLIPPKPPHPSSPPLTGERGSPPSSPAGQRVDPAVRGAGGGVEFFKTLSPSDLIVAGLLVAVAMGWLWTGIVAYVPTRLGIGGAPAYDEFRPLVAQIAPLQHDGDTLFILPETDSTPQLHPLTGMLPPGTWIKGWHWYFKPPGILDTLLNEWGANPPAFVIVFPDLIREGEPGILPLLDYVHGHYERVQTVDDVFLHGSAEVYQVKAVMSRKSDE